MKSKTDLKPDGKTPDVLAQDPAANQETDKREDMEDVNYANTERNLLATGEKFNEARDQVASGSWFKEDKDASPLK